MVMCGSCGYRRRPGGSDHFSLQTNRHFIIIYIYLHHLDNRPGGCSLQIKLLFFGFALGFSQCVVPNSWKTYVGSKIVHYLSDEELLSGGPHHENLGGESAT